MDLPKIKWEDVILKKLRLEKEYDESISPSLRYDRLQYSLRKTKVLTIAAAKLLVQLHPIIVVRKGSWFDVVAGKRTYHVAALCLEPKFKFTVGVLDRKITSEQLLLLSYMDLVAAPLIFKTNLSLAEIYKSANVPDLRQQVWVEPLATTMSSFAAALGVSPAALVTPSRGTKPVNKILPDDFSGDIP